MKPMHGNGRILGALLAFGALNSVALFAQKLDVPVLAAPAQSANQQDQGNNQNGQTTPDGSKRKTAWQMQSARIRKLMDDLNMTEDQRVQVRAILKNHRESIMATRKDASLGKEEKEAKLKGIRMDARKKFQEVLTPEQKEKLKAISAQWKKDHPKQNGGSAAGSSAQGQGNQTGAVQAAPPAAQDDEDPASVLIGDDDDGAPASSNTSK